MPMLAPAIPALKVAMPAIIGGLSGLFGNKGNKQNQQQQQSGNSSESNEGLSNLSSQQIKEIFENPLFAKAREGLLARLSQEFNRAERPVYGEAQQAKFMSKINDLAASGIDALKQQTAAAGGLQSGRYAGGLANIERAKLGEQVNFFSQLPFMEREQRDKRMDGLMGLAANWLGRAPQNEVITGNQTGHTASRSANIFEGTGNSLSSTNGTGGWQSMLQGLFQGILGQGAQNGWFNSSAGAGASPSTGVGVGGPGPFDPNDWPE